MKIPFDIKYRPQIESGEYKVCDQNGNDARIICWDALNKANPDQCIIALIKEGSNNDEDNKWYNTKGFGALGHNRLFIIIPEPELTKFEQYVESLMLNRPLDLDSPDFYDCVKDTAKILLDAAKKELFKQWNENMKDEYARGKKDGLTIGYNKAMKEYNESVSYHYPTYGPPCLHGGMCTNPFKDCINCPRTGGDIGISTTSGTCKKD